MSSALTTILAIIVWEAARKMTRKINQLERMLPHDAPFRPGWNDVDTISLQLITLGVIRLLCVASVLYRATRLL